jgi:hypothetical protein
MGKSNKLRQARRQQATNDVCALLEAHSKRKSDTAVAVTYGDFAPDYHAKIEAYRALALRPPELWRCRLKSRSHERRFIDLVRFVFARYGAPAHLERAWISEIEDDFTDDVRPRSRRRATPAARPDLRRWYLIATQGADRCTSRRRIPICRSSRPTTSSPRPMASRRTWRSGMRSPARAALIRAPRCGSRRRGSPTTRSPHRSGATWRASSRASRRRSLR